MSISDQIDTCFNPNRMGAAMKLLPKKARAWRCPKQKQIRKRFTGCFESNSLYEAANDPKPH